MPIFICVEIKVGAEEAEFKQARFSTVAVNFVGSSGAQDFQEFDLNKERACCLSLAKMFYFQKC